MRGLTYAAGEILVFMLAATLIGYVLGRLRSRARMRGRTEVYEPEPFDATPAVLSPALALDVELDQEVDDAESVPAMVSSAVALSVGADDGTLSVALADEGEEVAALVSEVDRQKDMIERLERIVEETDEASVIVAQRDARIVDLEAALTVFGQGGRVTPAYTSASSGSGVYADLRIDAEGRV